MTLPAGFKATLFAGDPDVVQPIAFTFDDRGRLWVVECLSYPDWNRGGGVGRDRVLIFEDTDGDGRFDERKVFFEGGSNLTGIEFGFGGVWLCSTPNLIFLPDRDGDDVPDAEPEIVLDGWSLDAKHNVFNGLTWGPDGWLYGCNGILETSRVGRPGTPDDQRVPMNCGVWRIHPVTREFEPVAWGTTNPWGLDFDQFGRMFITNCVIEHVFHVVPGGHYERMYGQDLNPHVYQLMESCADHIHWAGGDWQSSRGGEGAHDTAGGGHAHAGCMIYLGDSFPEAYRGRLFTCNIHGNRVNQDVLKAHRSGYVASHEPDFLRVPDTWFRGLELKYGPDGGVYLTDWSDTGECHDYEDIHRENGRIYKITYGDPAPPRVDLQTLSDGELLALQSHPNDWQARHARRILHERAAAGRLEDRKALLDEAVRDFRQASGDAPRQLRILWTQFALGACDEPLVLSLFDHDDEHVRAWAVRLELDDRAVSPIVLAQFARLAREDASPLVRLFLAAGLQRMKREHRWPIARGLLAHAEDADDPNIPLMIWYGVEPLVLLEPDRAAGLLALTEIPLVRQLVARRIASLEGRLDSLVRMLARIDAPADVPTRRDVLAGMHAELNGRRDVPMPAGWAELAPDLRASRDADVRTLATRLSLIFGDAQAL
ncbi:MAG TPA: PVC-type heme-binding CxxCH protein, partial [Planctomycetaceae bacterium]|nr:PVC-type heme-binding CxxCH protein [Planctomycetaceae bacterium]